jgi:hypothetical protein
MRVGHRVALTHVINAASIDNNSFGSTVAKCEVDQCRVVSNVERHDGKARMKTGDVESYQFGAIGQQSDDTIARLNTNGQEISSDA